MREFWATATIDEFMMTPRSIRQCWFKTGYIPTRDEVLFIIKRRADARRVENPWPWTMRAANEKLR